MLDLLKRLRNRLISKTEPEDVEPIVHAHLCEGKEWKSFPANLCEVCRGKSMNFVFPSLERFERAVEQKNKQLDRKAS